MGTSPDPITPGSSSAQVPLSPASAASFTQLQLAEALGLHQSTISLALRNSPRIPAKTRMKIKEAAEQMGYVSNAAAVILTHHKKASTPGRIHSAIAWVNTWGDHSGMYQYKEFAAYRRGAHATAEKFGYALEEFDVDASPSSLPQLQRILKARGIRGIVLPPSKQRLDLSSFDWSTFCTVRIGFSLAYPAAHIAAPDPMGNGRLGFEAIMKRGYRRIGWATYYERVPVGSRVRDVHEAGFLLAQMDVPMKNRLPVFEYDRQSLKRWIERTRPDAIFSNISNIVQLVRSAGHRVPEDIAVAGTTILDINVTAGIDQRSEEVGSAAIITLISHMNAHHMGIPSFYIQSLIPGRWADGDTLPFKAPANVCTSPQCWTPEE
ncbi:MAG TPA: LacI family DNA-binding transcriptional regulator [Candidatus Methylacidiphilales bacterium]|nr:LacI family DNA-binding transcriptional regulator [Candidatus Methylacidiphilales bacterium]